MLNYITPGANLPKKNYMEGTKMEKEYKEFFERHFTHVRSAQLTSSNIVDYQKMQDHLFDEISKLLPAEGQVLLGELEEMFINETVEKAEIAYKFGIEDANKLLKIHLHI